MMIRYKGWKYSTKVCISFYVSDIENLQILVCTLEGPFMRSWVYKYLYHTMLISYNCWEYSEFCSIV